jgi:hypothetical protein
VQDRNLHLLPRLIQHGALFPLSHLNEAQVQYKVSFPVTARKALRKSVMSHHMQGIS